MGRWDQGRAEGPSVVSRKTLQGTLAHYLCNPLEPKHSDVRAIIIPIFQMRKPRNREVKYISHRAQSQDSHSSYPDSALLTSMLSGLYE